MDDNLDVIAWCIIAFCLGLICALAFLGLRKKSKSKNEDKAIKVAKNKKNTKIKPEKNKRVDVPCSVSTTTTPQLNCNNNSESPRLSKKQLKRLQRKEEREKRRQEGLKKKDNAFTEQNIKAFNPKVSKPDNAEYTDLCISDGQLTVCTIGKTSYYHCWTYGDKLYYEFYCSSAKVAKAINNHSAIIDPFCVKHKDSTPFDLAKSLEVIEYGELSSEYKIINKSTVKFK